MTTLPTDGGSYLRHPDGRLELVEGSITTPAEPPAAPLIAQAAEAPAEPTRKGAIKAPLKE